MITWIKRKCSACFGSGRCCGGKCLYKCKACGGKGEYMKPVTTGLTRRSRREDT